MSWMFFLFGLASLTGQVLLLREILAVYHGTEISIGIFYGSWLSGIGLGAALGAWLVRKADRQFHSVFIYSLLALGFSVLVEITLVRNLPRIFAVAPAELAPLHGIAAAVPVGTLVTAFFTGFLFPVGCKSLAAADDRTIARLYVFEAVGSLSAGLLFTFVLVRLLPPLKTASLVAIGVGVGAIVYSKHVGRPRCLAWSVALLICCLTFFSPLGSRFIEWSIQSRWNALHPGLQLLEHSPTPYQQAEIARLGKQTSFFGNGRIVSSFPDPHTADRVAALVIAQKPEARKALLIGGGTSSLVRSLLAYPLEQIDVLEPDPWAFKLVRKYMQAPEAGALDDPRVRLIFIDGRLYVNRMGKAGYDLVIALMPDPVSAFWNRYYTLEFFGAVSQGLASGGVFVTGVTSADNFWGTEVASYAGSVYHTLMRVFPAVQATPGDETIFFASTLPDVVSLDPAVLARRYQKLGTQAFDPAAFETLLQPGKAEFVRKQLAEAPVLINTDLMPVSASLAMILWGKFSGTAHMELLNTVRRGGLKVYLIPILFFLVARLLFRARWGEREGRETRFQAVMAMAAVGACSMGLQIALMYAYQSLFGYVFERVALFAALFMAGLAAGGVAARIVLARVGGRLPAMIVPLLMLAAVCLSVQPSLHFLAAFDPWIVEVAIFSLVLFSGILTGAVFPLTASAHLRVTENAGQTSGWIDAADHFGAALGGMATGTLLVPLLGTGQACLVLSFVAVLPALLILAERLLSNVEPLLAQIRPHGPFSFPFVRLSWLLAFSVAGALTWHVLVGPPAKTFTVRFDDETLKQFSGSSRFEFREGPFPHYVGSSDDQAGTTISLATISAAGDIRGFGGPMNLLVSVSDKGIVKGVKLVESSETPSYIHGLDTWLGRFTGRSILGAPPEGIDALSGATITCRAAAEILEKTGRRIAGPILGMDLPMEARVSVSTWKALVMDVRLWLVVALIAFFVPAFHSRSRILRWICLAASFAILGIYLNAPFTCLEVAGLFGMEIPAVDTPWRMSLFLSVLVISILWGQAFCGFMCPFGALQEFLAFKQLRQRASLSMERSGRYVKFVILVIGLSLFLLTGDKVWFTFSPLQHFFRGEMDAWVMGLSVMVLAASLFYFRFWCRYLCPAGAFLALFNKIALLKKSAPKPIPARCDLGVAFAGDVDCIRCHRCLTTNVKAESSKV